MNIFFERLQKIGMLGREGQLRLEKTFQMVKKHRLDCNLVAHIIGRYLREMDRLFRHEGTDHKGYLWVAEEIATHFSPEQSSYLPFVLSIPEYDPGDTVRKTELSCEVELFLSPIRWAARKETEKNQLKKRRESLETEEREGVRAFQPLSSAWSKKKPEVSTSLPPWLENQTPDEHLPFVI